MKIKPNLFPFGLVRFCKNLTSCTLNYQKIQTEVDLESHTWLKGTLHQDDINIMPSRGSQPSRLSISGWTHRGPGTNCCPQLVVCHTDLSIPSSVVSFMSLSFNHSVIFEIAPKHTISESFADYDGYSISAKGFLPTVVYIMAIWVKFTHSSPF